MSETHIESKQFKWCWVKTVEMLHNVDRDHTVPYYNLKIIFFLVIPDFVFPCFSFIYPCSWGLENLSSGKKTKSLKSTLNFKVCPCNQTHQISGLISANNISLWVTFDLESKIPILAKIDLIRPYLSIGSRKNVQKSVSHGLESIMGLQNFCVA